MLIALSGHCNSGKNTLANYLTTKYDFVQFSFANKLKQICSTIYNQPLDYWEYDKEVILPELYNHTKRQVLQHYGNVLRTHNHEDYFVNDVVQKLNICTNINKVITDLRFNNELYKMIEINAIVIYIKRNNTKLVNNDVSESFYDYIKHNSNFIIYNNSTLTDMYEQFDFIYNSELPFRNLIDYVVNS